MFWGLGSRVWGFGRTRPEGPDVRALYSSRNFIETLISGGLSPANERPAEGGKPRRGAAGADARAQAPTVATYPAEGGGCREAQTFIETLVAGPPAPKAQALPMSVPPTGGSPAGRVRGSAQTFIGTLSRAAGAEGAGPA